MGDEAPQPRRERAFGCRLPAMPEAVPIARAIADRLDWLPLEPQRAFDLRVIVGELVANAVRHGERGDPEQWIGLAVMVDGDCVRVRVSDGGHGFRPHLCEHRADASAGRGLRVVDALADRWGVRRHARRTEVWVELALAGGPDAASAGARQLSARS